MNWKPVDFLEHDIRAILDGRKTQFRQIVKPQPEAGTDCPYHIGINENRKARTCRFGQIGTKLWVRETWRPMVDDVKLDCIEYKADGARIKPSIPDENTGFRFSADCDDARDSGKTHWRPSIQMPRWASRITLEVTGIRIERLNDITKADAIAEGCQVGIGAGNWRDSRDAFQRLWESIHGKGSQAANPWVWVLDFRLSNYPENVK